MVCRRVCDVCDPPWMSSNGMERERETMPATAMSLKAPRIAEHEGMTIAGLAQRYSLQTKGAIPALWQRFVPYLGSIAGQVGSDTYGVCFGYQPDGTFNYLCGVQVTAGQTLPAEFTAVEIPHKTFAVFAHTEHISVIGATWLAICEEWLPSSGCTLEGEPNFELYTDAFDPSSGCGLVEIWIPLKAGTAA